MNLDAKKIIKDTKKIFNDLLPLYHNLVSNEDYNSLHYKPLVPTNIKINCELFLFEIEKYQNYFEQWGKHHTHLPRYGIALVNQDGKLKQKDVINGSLYEHNVLNTDNPIIESDCLIPTELMNLKSLEPLTIFNGHWCRSNILKWGKTAEFMPHIDNVIPAPWIRLWATMSENIEVNFFDENTNRKIEIEKIEPGRVYIIDTSLVHNAINNNDGYNYQLFLCVLPNALNILRSII